MEYFMNDGIQKRLISEYKVLVRNDHNKDELYKWKLIQEFQEKWDIEADNFSGMLQNINFSNLVDYRSLFFINSADNYPEEARKLFKMLYDEEIPLKKRISDFGDIADHLVHDVDPDKGAFQDERTIATYLTFRYPDKYTFYKYSIYSDFIDLLNFGKEKAGDRYIHYLSLLEDFIDDFIKKDDELIELSRSTLTEGCFIDDNFNILAQDILYRTTQQTKSLDSQDSLNKILAALGEKKSNQFFDLVSDLAHRLELKEEDPRVVYTTRGEHNRLVFTIGQRYCLTIQKSTEKTWGYITPSKETNSDTVDISKFEGPLEAYWNKTESYNDVKDSLDKIESACNAELGRTRKSGYLKFNNSSIEKAVFDKNYREEIFMKAFNKSSDTRPGAFIDTLKEFLSQSKTDDLSYAHYQDEYNGLNVRVSFGKGNAARIPWISFLDDSQSTNEGIYPVYLLYKKRNLLILAYGVSEENEPPLNWEIENPVTIKQYFQNNDLGSPERYGSSYIYKVYDLNEPLDDYPIDNDLHHLTNFYKEIISTPKQVLKQVLFNLGLLKTSLNNSHLIYDDNIASRFSSALLSKPFLILTGLSGSGKTKLAQAFAKWIIEENKQLNLVPVGADWTNREPLLGYPNALEKGQYVLPESGVLQLILNAKKDPERPYFLILDEMNLSHVERYFADFLSAIESKEEIKLHSGSKNWEADGYQVPPNLSVPQNLFIIGTVNIDETTYMFSPKVLDRANVIEFRVSKNEMERFLEAPADVDLSELEGKGANMAKDFVKIATNPAAEFSDKNLLSDELIQFFESLTEVGAEFGYRTAHEINRFASLSEHLAEDWEFDQIMDAAISQKLLPKLHGSRRKLESVLFKLGQLCIKEGEAEELLKKPSSIDWKNNVKYPISLEKIMRMHKGLLENGFTSFAEA